MVRVLVRVLVLTGGGVRFLDADLLGGQVFHIWCPRWCNLLDVILVAVDPPEKSLTFWGVELNTS